METVDIAFLLNRFESMDANERVVLKKNKETPGVATAGLLDKLGGSGGTGGDELIAYLGEVVSRESGPSSAGEMEKLLRNALEANKVLTVGQCRTALRRYALKTGDAAALKEFLAGISEGVLTFLKFSSLSPYCQLAVMRGVQGGLELMQAVEGLLELDEGVLRPDSQALPLESVQKAQRILAKGLKDWATAMISALPERTMEQELPRARKIVYLLLQALHADKMGAFVNSLSAGPVADIFAMQGAALKSLNSFASELPLPPGIDARAPARRRRMLCEMLYWALCRRFEKQLGTTAEEAKARATALIQPDVRVCMGRLLKLFLNHLLSELPSEKELRPRASIKNFDAEGFHADFVRDCIARRYSFTIEGFGKLDNALEREAAVGSGKRDIEFFEKKLEEMLNSGQKEQAKNWTRPEVRTSASMTESDLRSSQELAMRGIPDRNMRMAITRIANQGSLGLFEAFYGKEPSIGANFESSDKQMLIRFLPRRSEFFVEAMLHNGKIKATERREGGEEGDDEMDISGVNFFHLEYSCMLKKEQDKASGKVRWEAASVTVEVLSLNMLPIAQMREGASE